MALSKAKFVVTDPVGAQFRLRRFAAPKYAWCHGRFAKPPKCRIQNFGHASQGMPNSSNWYLQLSSGSTPRRLLTFLVDFHRFITLARRPILDDCAAQCSEIYPYDEG